MPLTSTARKESSFLAVFLCNPAAFVQSVIKHGYFFEKPHGL
ncbi:hypothetical protein GbCGDNIH3_7245 [Granulibacter bethesdensis]|uniref:Uncharacterized protein n=1 Tax=Granulibacter bethesdensis TaxID=364410 RepID=A0AAN0VGD4_9PROT|nr:hypothetical protein GbCGDNIH3_7245 [Granulibacter bethesdensis]AHJ65637.1 hypothetical protein GbCGDNIH4_7030 [Granulibacter bethesdensis CGDNIH4]APH60237.1 hypothetical protein GbCGDNIH7_7245 [Granulibacter bethesdensis]